MQVAHTMALRSRCEGRQIGAVIVSDKMRIVATGYNGTPATFPSDAGCSVFCPRRMTSDQTPRYDNCVSVHAEANALLYVDRQHCEGATLYVTSAMCYSCAKLVAASGIKRVVMVVSPSDEHRDPDKSIRFLKTCDVEVMIWT